MAEVQAREAIARDQRARHLAEAKQVEEFQQMKRKQQEEEAVRKSNMGTLHRYCSHSFFFINHAHGCMSDNAMIPPH
jgi:hypothetical protein